MGAVSPQRDQGCKEPIGALTIKGGHSEWGSLLDPLQTTWLAGSQGRHSTSEPLSIQGASPTCPGPWPPFSLPEALSPPAPRDTRVG